MNITASQPRLRPVGPNCDNQRHAVPGAAVSQLLRPSQPGGATRHCGAVYPPFGAVMTANACANISLFFPDEIFDFISAKRLASRLFT